MNEPEQLPLDLSPQPALNPEDFLTADCNRDAEAWLAHWPEWPARTLVLYGPAGCGKTHLLTIWQRRAAALLITPEALPTIDPSAIVERSRAVAIDDVDRAFRGPDSGILLHLYNLMQEAQGWLLLTGRTPPSAWPISPPDLASRLKAAVSVPIREPDDSLLAALLVKQFADRQLAVSPEVIRYLSTRVDRSFAAVRQVVAALDYASLAEQRKVTKSLAASVLAQHDAAE